MEIESLEIPLRYIVDADGNKTGVILDIATFEKLLERLEDLYFGLRAERALKDGEFVDFDEVKKSCL